MRLKSAFLLVLLAFGVQFFTGCAASPRRERPPVVEPVAQAQPAGPTAEEERLRRQLEEEQAARAKAEADRRALESQLDDALASQKSAPKKSQDSYLK